MSASNSVNIVNLSMTQFNAVFSVTGNSVNSVNIVLKEEFRG